MSGCCEHSNETSCSIEGGQFLKKDSAAWSQLHSHDMRQVNVRSKV
jgi:hypothetical protein